MSLIINAFYSNKEIFLRELISNASDAMDKIQYEGVADPAKLAVNPEMYINISADRESRTVIVEDAGIGMTRDDLVNNLGTIAKSGTKAFMEYVSSGADMTMIGQFGVGFYSSYLVAEKVVVVSKSTDDDQYVWESTAGGTFTVWKDEKFEHGTLKRGTKVICYLKDDIQQEFLDTDRLKELVLKHSAFVGFPISIHMESRREEDVEGSEEKVVTIKHKWELINKNKPVWMRQPEDVQHEEYAELYKFLANDYEDHLGVKHVIQSGQVVYKALLFCPRSAPKDMFDMGKMAQRFSIRLYVRRVFIKEFFDLIPKWMGFIKGIVDSDDMPLNIGREKLQENAILKHIKAGLQKHAFQMFEDLVQDKAAYKVFYEQFSQCLKLGVYEDTANRTRIIPLLRYYSSKSGEGIISLDEYVARMKPGQNYILYITGRSRRDASRSPYIEGLKRDGYEIIYMVDPVDEYAIQFMKEYQGKELMSCMNQNATALIGGLRTDEEKKAEFTPLGRRLQALLSDKFGIGLVRFSTDFAAECCAKIKDSFLYSYVLELNFKHGLLKELLKHSEGKADLEDIAKLLYQIALLDGVDAEDPAREPAYKACQALMQDLNAGEQDDCRDDVPLFNSEVVSVAENGDSPAGKAASKSSALISCGSSVRVVKQDRSRRATISFVEEDDGTVDVMYSASPSGPEEEEGVPTKAVQALLDFELDSKADEQARFKESLFKAASAAKEQGNALYKLMDFDAASERYSTIIAAFAARVPARGDEVLVAVDGKLKVDTAGSVDADGTCELTSAGEVQAGEVLPIFQELLPLQAAAYMNRARCLQSLECHQRAAQDLTAVLGLWEGANKRMMEADKEMQDACTKGLYTAQYLRAKSRLARGLVKQAAADVRDALKRNPPAATQKQLRELNTRVQAALEEHRRMNAPLAKELAKVSIAIRGMPKIS
jgi:molecular chaperone HtpG